MEKIVLAAGLVALLCATLYMTNNSPQTQYSQPTVIRDPIDTQVYDLYTDWKMKYNRKYSSEEEVHRYTIFKDNYITIKDFYEGPQQTHSLDFNKFMDLSKQEFTETYLGLKPQSTKGEQYNATHEALDSVDWRIKGVLNEIRDQGQCGSCWAFSAIGAIESAHAIVGKGLKQFSEQELVDCSVEYGNNGCSGGLMDNAFQYVIEHGINSRVIYPYVARDQPCQNMTNSDVSRITSFKDVPYKNCAALEKALSKRPISVAVDATTWQFYSGGILSNCGKDTNQDANQDANQLNHGVVLVAYDKKQWIVRNSWSTSWGEQGHIRLAKGDTCGICQAASFPVV